MPPPSPQPPVSGGSAANRAAAPVAGRYELGERLGAGGMGVVHRATDTRLGREVALKLLAPRLHADDRARQRLLHEARAVATLDHPHVAGVFDVGETEDGRLFVAMPFYRGETLRERLARGPLAAEDAAQIAREVASGLGAAHRAGIVHRDVKPANVMLAEEGGETRAKVLDFGIAQTGDADLTRTGESLGTALYMSPEQMRGEATDARSDVWALGAVLYETLAGRRPFEGSYAAAVGYAVLHEDPPPLGPLAGDLPEGLEAVVMRCLEKAPEARYPSMEALEADLAAVLGSGAPTAADRPAVGAGARGQARLWRWAAVAAVAAAAAVGTVALWPGSAEAGPQRLVVLPFSASGPDAEPLARGLVEAVASKLSALGPLSERVRVVPASEVPESMTPSEARERFGADLAVEGRVVTEGDTVRVTVGLIEVGAEVATRVPGGSREIHDGSGSALALQDAAALEVASLLRIEVGEEAQEALASGGTDDPEANALYLRGRGVLRGYQSVDDLDRARGLFEKAVALDPDFALAHAGLAEAQWQTFRRTGDVDWTDRALASGQRALALDDRLPEVHVAMAVVHRGRSEYTEALAAIDQALALAPQNPEAIRRKGQILADMDRTEAAAREFRRAIQLAPDFWRPYNNLGVLYLDDQKIAQAREQFERGLEVDPVNIPLLSNLGVAAFQDGDFEGSADAAREVLRLDPSNEIATYNLASAAFYLGDYAAAVEAAERAVALTPNDYGAHVLLAEALWWTPGQRGPAEASLRRAIPLARRSLGVSRSPYPLLALAQAFALTGQQDSARVVLREIETRLSPEASDVQDVFAAGLVFEMAGERRRALSWLSASIQREYGATHLERSPWLRDLRSDPFAASLTPDP